MKILRNLITDNTSEGIQSNFGKNITVSENTIASNGGTGNTDPGERQGILFYQVESSTVSKNIISNNAAQGIQVDSSSSLGQIKITQNSIFGNTGLGIDLQNYGSPSAVTPNNGTKSATLNNNDMDYPVITASSLTGNTLTVRGFVGNTPAGSTTFANATLEFFIADNTPADQNGEVIVGDGKSKPHGEGRTYIGTCTDDANSLFNCSFSNASALGITDPLNITATATDAAGNTSEFSAIPNNKANVLMVKRITAIKDGLTGTVTPYNTFVDDTTSTTATNDNNCGWPGAVGTGGVCTTNTYTLGATSETAIKVKPGDEIEYTIYYLNAGENKARQVRICDQLDRNLTFQGDTPTTPATTAPLDIRIFPGSSGPVQSLTNVTDGDNGQLTTPALAGTSCNLAANTDTNLSNNVVVVEVAPLTGSTGVGIPTTSYGYVRIQTTVK